MTPFDVVVFLMQGSLVTMASMSVSKGLARALLGVETSDGRDSVMFFSTMGESPSESSVSREVFGSRRVVVV